MTQGSNYNSEPSPLRAGLRKVLRHKIVSMLRGTCAALVPSNLVVTVILGVLSIVIASNSSDKILWLCLTISFGLLLSVPGNVMRAYLDEDEAQELTSLGEKVSSLETSIQSLITREQDNILREQADLVGLRDVVHPVDGPNSLQYCLEPSVNHHTLWIMGLQSSKWINYGPGKGEKLDGLLKDGAYKDVRFLLVDPEGETIQCLKGSRGESILRADAIRRLEQLAKQHSSSLRVRYYDQIPVFRMIFCDNTLIASCYALDSNNIQFLTNAGSDAPHLQFAKIPGTDGTRSLYAAYERYYDILWNNSRDPLTIMESIRQ